MLSEHADGSETSRIQLAGTEDEAVVEVGPDTVLLNRAVVRGHRLGARGGERHVDFAGVHEADDLLEAFGDVSV